MNNFETIERIIAVNPSSIELLYSQLVAQYGQLLPDGTRTIITIGAHWDDEAKTRIRAASLTDGTITPQPLIDGRIAFQCLWQSDLAAAFDLGRIAGVEELTATELSTLILQTASTL